MGEKEGQECDDEIGTGTWASHGEWAVMGSR